MSEPRDHDTILRRWNWTAWGYEDGFPRGCQFTDVDAAVEFDKRRLLIETKHHEGAPTPLPPLATGQQLFYQNEVRVNGTTVLVLYGDEQRNDPFAIYDVGREQWFDWRGLDGEERRARLKNHINRAMGLPVVKLTVVEPRCLCGAPVTTVVAGHGYCEDCEPF